MRLGSTFKEREIKGEGDKGRERERERKKERERCNNAQGTV
jgi:hypothetical protein